jgi:hypothetical protein
MKDQGILRFNTEIFELELPEFGIYPRLDYDDPIATIPRTSDLQQSTAHAYAQ